ncbi:hypothetical protein CR513_45760, partial [Mucuna pruriens]
MSDPPFLTKSTKDVIFLFLLYLGTKLSNIYWFNYFITFIDLMKERFEILSILMSFSKEVKNKFGKTIKNIEK